MASNVTTQGQEAVLCDLCQSPVSFFCQRCGVNLCDPCVLLHLRVKSKFGHDVVDYASKDDDDVCLCGSHPENKCSAYCKECDVPICILCVSIKHKSHEISELQDKIDELLKDINRENDRLQSFRDDLERVLDHTTKTASSLPSVYERKKDEVTARGEDWKKQIDNHVKKLHQELDELKKENEAILLKQKKEFEDVIGKIDEMNRKSTKLQNSKNVTEMQKFRPVITEQKTLKEFTQYTFPTFNKCKIDENYLQNYFGYIEELNKRKISLLKEKIYKPHPNSDRKVLEAPSVSSVIDTGFPASGKNNRLYDMAVTDDQKVWMGGASKELKLFDLQGHLERTVTITTHGMYICMYNKQVLYTGTNTKAVKKISDDDTVVIMFTTGDWTPFGITGSASGDLLVCLCKDDQSKVVRYSSTGTVLQEIQYDSQCQPLYLDAYYIAENVNGDIIVTDFKMKKVITVDRLGIFRYSYSGGKSASSVATDSVGHVYVTDYLGDKIHMLDRDGRFLGYVTPEGGIKYPRAVCMVGDGEMIVGECKTGLAKRTKFFEFITEIYFVYNIYVDPNPVLCKITRFITFSMNNASSFVLLFIAVDRFKRIYKPLKPPYSNRVTKIVIGRAEQYLELTWETPERHLFISNGGKLSQLRKHSGTVHVQFLQVHSTTMASNVTTQGQEAVVCDLCQSPVSFFCRHCRINLCDPCVLLHLRVKSKFGHDVVDYASKDDECLCDSHPENKCSAYCKKCDIPICILCVSIKHKSHEIFELQDKINELLTVITRENDRLQSFRDELQRVLDHTTKTASSLSSVYERKKDEVTARGNDWHKLIDNHVKKLHQELDDLKNENEAVLLKQKKEYEDVIGKIDEMNRKSSKLQNSKNVTEMQKFGPVITEQNTLKELTQYTLPTFYKCEIDEHYLQNYFGYIEKMHEKKISLLKEKLSIPDPDSGRIVLKMPSVSSVIDTGFPASEKYNNRLYDMAVTDDQKVWMGGNSYELKLFDLQGHLQHTVNTTNTGMYICMFNKQVMYSDQNNNTVKKISDDDTVVTMFTTGDWRPLGITGSASGNLLVGLDKDDQSKVVRYSSNGTVLQEIQYDSQGQPLYQKARYIAENINGDIIVTDFKMRKMIAVDRLGIFRYSYSGGESASSVATDSVGHVYVTDFNGDKIHMLDRDGRFLRYIIPEGGIKNPRAVCMIGDGDMIVGECLTGLAKRIKLFGKET
uniref:Uncharacterized protein LOC111122792 n=1 Tax=Crassostrea virginica TaxID=6565 RepID=A0A8B8D0Y4_CRAVI|nr:uncharacterized protein LOC111122792 [Crassostrea virginica]